MNQELRNAEEIIKKLEIFEIIFKLSSDEIFVTDRNGICILVNPACEKNSGLPVNELLGRNVQEIVDQGIFSPSATLMVLEKKETVSIIQTTSQGKRLFCTSTPVFDESNEIVLVISNTIDVTEVFSLKEKIVVMEELIENYNDQLTKISMKNPTFGTRIVANGPKMTKILNLLERLSKVDSTLLLLGESGVGKTEVAKWVHENSNRKNHTFVEINCGAIPLNLFESELFGYDAGAFSGALAAGRKGLIEHADKGTLFLDEIGELSLELQTKLLQVIQSKSFIKVGGREKKTVDVRIITATNRNLEEMVLNGEFRQDLFYRLSVVPVTIPPLRDRHEDLIDLILLLLDRINKKYNTNKILSPNLLKMFMTYHWPGNIRELENKLERLVVTTRGVVIEHDLDFSYNDSTDHLNEEYIDTDLRLFDEVFGDSNLSLNRRLEIVEKEILKRYLNRLGSTRKVASILKSSQSTISRKCINYDLNN